MNLILTPVYKSYDVVKRMCQAIDQFTVNPYLHILIDDDSNLTEPFPVKASEKRRIILLKRDYPGMIHRNGSGQAMQLGYDWANQIFINKEQNFLPYQYTFLVEADVIVQENWDQKMINLIPTLPSDWLTLDVQSIDYKGNKVKPMDNTPVLSLVREDLEVTDYPDFQQTLFNNKIFDAGIQFSSFSDHFDTAFGKTTINIMGGRHLRSKVLFAYHLVAQSTKFLTEKPIK